MRPYLKEMMLQKNKKLFAVQIKESVKNWTNQKIIPCQKKKKKLHKNYQIKMQLYNQISLRFKINKDKKIKINRETQE